MASEPVKSHLCPLQPDAALTATGVPGALAGLSRNGWGQGELGDIAASPLYLHPYHWD